MNKNIKTFLTSMTSCTSLHVVYLRAALSCIAATRISCRRIVRTRWELFSHVRWLTVADLLHGRSLLFAGEFSRHVKWGRNPPPTSVPPLLLLFFVHYNSKKTAQHVYIRKDRYTVKQQKPKKFTCKKLNKTSQNLAILRT